MTAATREICVQEKINPYRPPDEQPCKAEVAPPPRSRMYSLCLILVTASAIGYTVFIGMLLFTTDSNDDHTAGGMFCGNLPVLALWVGLVARKNKLAYLGGVVGLLVQFVIHVLMIAMGIGDPWTVYLINGAILVGFAVLAWLCYWSITRGVVQDQGVEP